MILDTFVSMFTADTKGLKDGHGQARKSTDEIVDSMKQAESQAKSTADKMVKFAKGAAGFLATAYSTSKLISTAVAQADTIATMDNTAKSIGVAVGELDAFNKALGDTGATASASEQALVNMYKNAGTAANNAESSQAQLFRRLGVSVTDASGKVRSATDLMGDLLSVTEHLDAASARDIYAQLGITDEKVIQQMLLGRKALEAQIKAHKEAGVVTKQQAEIAQKYSTASTAFNNALERSKNTIMQTFLPAITWGVEALTKLVDWMTKNKHFVIGFFGAIAIAVATLYLPAMISAAAATLAATWPILAIAAVIGIAAAAIALIYDDIMNWIDGNDSLIGQLIEDYPIIGDIIDGIRAAVAWLVDAFFNAIEAGKQFGDKTIEAFKNVKDWAFDTFNSIKQLVADVFDWIVNKVKTVSGIAGKIAGFFGFGGKGKAEMEVSTKENKSVRKEEQIEHFSSVKAEPIAVDIDALELEKLGKDIELISADKNSAIQQINAQSAAPINSLTSNTISNSTRGGNVENSIGIGELTIQTQATDAAGIAGDMRSELQNQLQNLQAETSSGVER